MLYRRIIKYEVSAFGNVKLCLTDRDVVLENKDSERKNDGCLQYYGIKENLLCSSKNKSKFKALQFVLNRTYKI